MCRYVFRGVGIVLLIGMVTALFLIINSGRHIESVPPKSQGARQFAEPRDSRTAGVEGMLANLNFLKTPAKIADTAKAAAMIASDRFRLLTGTVVNSSAGAALD